MELKILKKQNNTPDCLVCGLHNDASLHTRFYELEGNIVCGVFRNENRHQSFPGRMHGGMISAILDETIGRAVMIKDPDQWGVTGELKVRFLRPTPLDQELQCFGKLYAENSRLFKGVGYLETLDGTIVATGEATYFKLDLDKITSETEHDIWYQEKGEIPESISTNNINELDSLIQKLKK